MIRELIKPVDNTYILNLPDEMVGKNVEVIAFEIGEGDILGSNQKPSPNIEDIKKRYAQYPVISHDNYKFDRDEANDYE